MRFTRQTIASITALLLSALAPGCARKEQAAPTTAAPAKAAAPAGTASQKAPAPQASAPVTGKVLETMDAAGYTYLRLETSTGEIWAAVNQAVVAKGSEVTIVGAMPMDGFESKTLNRKFEKILFGSLGSKDGAAPAGAGDLAAAASHGAPASQGAPAQPAPKDPHAAASTGAADVGPINVKKAEGKDGKTVAQIFAEKASLKDASVSVRGKVVKFNANIMGRNWLHVRDGSGSPDKHDDDIVVTTKDEAAVGDVVLVKGTVHLDKDFGMGYSYQVIVEDAKVSK